MALLSTDDWGVFEATPKVLKGQCYPLQDATKAIGSKGSIGSMNAELAKEGIVNFWKAGDRTFGHFIKFNDYNELEFQREPEYPCPPWMLENGIDLRLSPSSKRLFERIESATKRLVADGEKATYQKIAMVAKCSYRDVSSYCKHKEKISCYQILPSATNATVDLDYDLDLELEEECTPPTPPAAPREKKNPSRKDYQEIIDHYQIVYKISSKEETQINMRERLEKFGKKYLKRRRLLENFVTDCKDLITAINSTWKEGIPKGFNIIFQYSTQRETGDDQFLKRMEELDAWRRGEKRTPEKQSEYADDKPQDLRKLV